MERRTLLVAASVGLLVGAGSCPIHPFRTTICPHPRAWTSTGPS